MTRIPYRRKREGRTNYAKRLKLLMSQKPRLVVRKSGKSMLVQVVQYAESGDQVLITSHTNELRKLGWTFGTGSTPAAYLAGYIAGKKSLAKGITEAVVDLGLQSKGERLFAAVKGALDAGLEVPVDPEAMPKPERLIGKHITQYALQKPKNQFTLAAKLSMDDIPKIVAQIKEKLT